MPSTPLEVNFWDVGQGDCSTINLPDGKIVIIDTGPRGSPLIDWLRDHPKQVHAVVLTHNDADHAGSLPALVGSFMDRITGMFLLVDRPTSSPVFDKIFRSALDGERRRYYTIRRLEDGVVIWSDSKMRAELVAVFPTMSANVTASTPNVTSGILCLRIDGKTQVIWPGDAPLETVAAVCANAKPYVLFGPHHGAPADYKRAAATSSIAAIDPSRAFISVATKNPYSHPRPKYIQLLERAGCRVVCSQMTNCCDRRQVGSGLSVVPSHLALGLRPPRSGVACRGAWRLTWNGKSFQSDAFDDLHLSRIQSLKRAQCLRGRNFKPAKPTISWRRLFALSITPRRVH